MSLLHWRAKPEAMLGILLLTWSSSICLLHVDLMLLSSNLVLQVLQELLRVRCAGPGALVCIAPKEDGEQALHEHWAFKVHSWLGGIQAAALAQQLVPTPAGKGDTAARSPLARDLNMPRYKHALMGHVPGEACVDQVKSRPTAGMCKCTQRSPPLRLQGPATGLIKRDQTYLQAVPDASCMQAACALSHGVSADREDAEQAAKVRQAHLLTASWGSTAATR